MTTPSTTAVIILNWNGAEKTIECLASLQTMDYRPFEVILIDNKSTDNSVAELIDWLKSEKSAFSMELSVNNARPAQPSNISQQLPLYFILSDSNLGYAGGCNIGIRHALARNFNYIWLLNNDTIVDKTTLSEMINIANSSSDIGMVGSKIYFFLFPNLIWFSGGTLSRWFLAPNHEGFNTYDNDEFVGSHPIQFLTGCSLLVKNEVVKQIGLLHEPYFLYFEDVEWSSKARKHGWKICVASRSHVWHKTTLSTTPYQIYYTIRNRFLFTLRYSPMKIPLVLFHFCKGNVLPHIIKRRWVPLKASLLGFFDFCLGKFGKQKHRELIS